MCEIPLYYRYDGEWNKKEDKSYEWLSRNDQMMSILILDDPNKIKLSELHDRICERNQVDRTTTKIKLSYIPLSYNVLSPIHILDDFEAKCYFLDRCNISKCRSILYVELIKNEELETGNDKEIFEVVDRETYQNDNDEICQDEYSNVNVEEPRVYEIISTSGCEGDILNESMSVENVLHEITTSIIHAPTPNRQSICLDLDVDYCESPVVDDTCKAFSFDDGLNIEIGQEFKNKMEVKKLVIDASIKSCFGFKIEKSTPKLFVAKCKVDDCKWALRAAIVEGSDRFSLRTYCNIHTCSSSSVDKESKKATSQLVADMLAKEYPGKMDTPAPHQIMEVMNSRGIKVSYFKAWMGKRIAASNIRGKPELSYGTLPSYLHMMKLVNPGTVVDLVVNEENKFKCLFFALGACIEGFKAMRKVIAIDGTFLKTIYGGTLLVCTAQDGNKHQYPLAFAVVKSESDESWNWFLVKLKELIPDNEELVIISDRHKSIIKAVSDVYKKAEHGFCAWHISQNIKSYVSKGNHVRDKKCKKKVEETIQSKFMAAATAYTEDEFKHLYTDLTNKYPAVHVYLESSVDVKKWARCYFVSSRYNILTTNGAESINSALKKARSYPLIPMIDAIMMKICTWFNNHRNEAGDGSSSQFLTPTVENVLHARYKESKFFKVEELNRITGEYYVTGENNRFLVNLEKRTCTCKVYDIDQIPCVHALAAFPDGTNNMHNLCSTYYLKELWALSYHRTIYPVPSECEWDVPDYIQATKVLPPDVIRKRGRMQMTRFPSVGERRKCKSTKSRRATIF